MDGRCTSTDAGRTDTDGSDTGTPPTLLSLRVVPADPIVTSVNGATVSVDLDAEATWSDATTSLVAVGLWTIDSTRVGDIDAAAGVFTANGELAGTLTATVNALSMTATTTVTVRIEHEIVVGTTRPGASLLFSPTPIDDPARRANLLYPPSSALMPQNVFPADVQWEGGVTGDVYRVTLVAPGVQVRAYVEHDGMFHWPVPRTAWRALAEAGPEADVTVTVDRWDMSGGVTIAGAPITFQFANATIRGSVYYWDLGAGKILRIRGDGTGLEDFLPTPPPRPGDGVRCVACHSISADGRRMSAELWGGNRQGTVFDLTVDLTTDPAPTLFTPSTVFLFSTLNPDGSRLVANAGNGLFLMDGNTGATLPTTGSPLPTTGAAHPAWSPEGGWLAYISGTNGTWAVDFSAGNVTVQPAWAGDAFGPPTTVFTGGALTAAHPSWSPDANWIAFQLGSHSRSHLSGVDHPGNVRMVSRDGTSFHDLANLNGPGNDSFYPTFSPFDEGGYYWLAFFSRRDYGNAQVGTRGTGRRQLWVAAVASTPRADLPTGADPSRVAYWLPEQRVSQHNMAAQWAVEPCRADARSCATSAECCSGFCRDTGTGLVCVPPTTVTCSMAGEICGVDGDCCPGEGPCSGNRCGVILM